MESNVQYFFKQAEVDQLARQCGFVKRTSPITGFNFLLTMTTGQLNTPCGTLAQMAAFLSSICGAEVSPQAIDERLRISAMAFMRNCLDMALSMATRPRASDHGALAEFTHIYIIDSTTFDIPPSFREIFKGCGGAGSAAAMRVQLVLDYLTGRLYVECGDTKLCDAPTLQRIVDTHALDVSGTCLFLADLGYFKIATYNAMSQQDLHFVSKLAFGVKLQYPTGLPVDLTGILKKQPASFNLTVIMNGQLYRLAACKLPEEVVNQRLRKANKTARENRGCNITDNYRLFLGYAICLTNLPSAYGMNVLYCLYRIRWQIELVFKTWKSILSINKINTHRLERLMCEIYGKLIIAVFSSVMAAAAETAYDVLIISLHRTMKHLQVIAQQWSLAIVQGVEALAAFVTKQACYIARLCKKNYQKNKPTLESRLHACVFENNDTITGTQIPQMTLA